MARGVHVVGKLAAAAVIACAVFGGGLVGRSPAGVTHAQTAGLVVVSDVALGAGPGVPPNQTCAIRSTFPQGQEIVFRVKVIDPATGAGLDDTQLAGVTITLPDGSMQNFRYGSHPPGPMGPKDLYWTYVFEIPADYPTGAFQYSIVATDLAGNTYMPVGFAAGAPDVQIVPAGQF